MHLLLIACVENIRGMTNGTVGTVAVVFYGYPLSGSNAREARRSGEAGLGGELLLE